MIFPGKPKILLVPAWYPALFFSEQMKLVKDTFDFKIVTGNRNEIGKKSAFKKIVSGTFKKFKWNVNIVSGEEDEHIITVDYSYVNSLPRYLERKQYQKLNKNFEKLFDVLTDSGWVPDLVHIQSLSDTSVFICNWADIHQIPVILTEHIIYIRRKFDFFQREKEKVYTRVKKVLFVSNYVYRNLLTCGFKMKDAGIIGNFVDERFVPASFEKKTCTTKMLFVASHLSDKDIHIFFDAIKILVNSGITDCKADIIGLDPENIYPSDTVYNLSLIQYIENNGLQDFIEIKGRMTNTELLQTYKDYSFLVSTSFSETFGLAVAEAILNGLPVVCTDSGGIRDFVDESNGIIVPVRDPQAISDAIKTIIQNLDAYDSVIISRKIKNKFGKDEFRKRMISEFNGVLKAG